VGGDRPPVATRAPGATRRDWRAAHDGVTAARPESGDAMGAPRPLRDVVLPLQTPRLRLRTLVPADADAMAGYRSLPEVCRYIPPEPMSAGELRERIEERWAELPTDDGDPLFLAMELRDGRLVGDVMLRVASTVHQCAEVGWVLDPRFGGEGLATEAAHGVLHLAFDDLALRRATARVDARNGPSARLAERLGMRREAHLVENELFKGEWSDELDFALLAREWRALHDAGSPEVARLCPRR
jgi:RimJ/RimL family protein N-acetyltransferase